MARIIGGLYLAFYRVEGKRRRQQVSIPETKEGDCAKVVDQVKDILVTEHAVAESAVEMISLEALHLEGKGKSWVTESPQPKDDDPTKGKAGIPAKAGIRKMRKGDLLDLAEKRGIPGVNVDMKVDDIRTQIIRALYKE